jgi:uncharacterized membrane protein YphA (DoxX/SURF4 family)
MAVAFRWRELEMAAKKGSSVAVWATTIILAAVFLLAGVTKFTNGEAVKAFENWGYPDWFRILIGVLEIAGALLLLYPKTASLGAITLACIMVGATITILRAATPLGYGTLLSAAFPVLFFVSLSSLAYYRFPRKTPPE